MTSSLFATTVLASFLVVALPHVLPCPAPRRAYADGEMPSPGDAEAVRRRRRRRVGTTKPEEFVGGPDGHHHHQGEDAAVDTTTSRIGIVEFRPGTGDLNNDGNGDGLRRRVKAARRGRECPVPKPGGILGEWLGFNGGGGRNKDGEGKTRPER
jgi:cytochrome c oxidase assembly factor 2